MNIHQVPAQHGWRAAFYHNGELEINPVIAGGFPNLEKNDTDDIDGFMVVRSREIIGVNKSEDKEHGQP